MEQLGDAQLSDVLRRMVGVSLKDYGGIGGIKTVSARGLGSQFSTLTIDGVAVTDCQNGQVDLGRYMLGNSSYISLSNGQMDNTLNSAKAYAAGSIINMETHEPEFGARPFNLRLGAEGGSYGLLSPTLSYEQRIGQRMSLSFWGNYLQSKGDYPFTYRNHMLTVSDRRKNSEVENCRLEGNLFYHNKQREAQAKIFYYRSRQQLPGAIVYYNPEGKGYHKHSSCVSMSCASGIL
jgi:outer membrane cobalamin receptor